MPSAIAADAHKASAKIKSEIPGRGQQAEKEAEALGQRTGAKIDSAVSPTMHCILDKAA